MLRGIWTCRQIKPIVIYNRDTNVKEWAMLKKII